MPSQTSQNAKSSTPDKPSKPSAPRTQGGYSRELIVGDLAKLAIILGQEISRERLMIYAQHLSSWTPEQVDLAIRRAATEQEFFPTLRRLRELAGAGEIRNQRFEEDWAFLQGWIRRHGVKGNPVREPVVRKDEHGTALIIGRGPEIPAPAFAPHLERALRRFGTGDLTYALQVLKSHPSLCGPEFYRSDDDGQRRGEQILANFRKCWDNTIGSDETAIVQVIN